MKYGSPVYTDDAVPYDKLKWKYIHETVNHAETYVNGRVHTNGLENFWSLLKRGLKGTYVAVEPFHLERYIDEQVFRFNNRATADNPLNDSDRFLLALSQVSTRNEMGDDERFQAVISRIAGKRLTYKELTGKSENTSVSTTPEPF